MLDKNLPNIYSMKNVELKKGKMLTITSSGNFILFQSEEPGNEDFSFFALGPILIFYKICWTQ